MLLSRCYYVVITLLLCCYHVVVMLLSRCYYVVDAKGNLSQPYQEPWVQDLAIAQTVVMVVGMTGAIITLLTMMRAST